MTSFAVALLSLVLSVAPPAIKGPDGPVKPRHVAWLWLEGLDENTQAVFTPEDFLTTGPPHIIPGHALFWADKPGRYTVAATAVTVDWDARKFQLIPLKHVVVVEGENGPDPPPPPPPVGSYGIAIFYQSDRLEEVGYLTVEQRDILSSLTFRDRLRDAGHQLWRFDIDATGPDGVPPSWKPWLDAAKGCQLPCVVVSRKRDDGMYEEYTVKPLPKTKQEFWNLIGGEE